MGFSIMRRRSSSSYEGASATAGNPNPGRWTLVREEQLGRACVLEVHYPDCRNYEGRKIMVFRASGLAEIMIKNKGQLDPHFSSSTAFLSPVARFEPTSSGWTLARACARSL